MTRGATPPFNLEEWLQSLQVFDEETEETAFIVYNGTINNITNPVYLFNGTEKTVAICSRTGGGIVIAVNEDGLYDAESEPGTIWDAPLIENAGLTDFSSAGSVIVDISINSINGRLDQA